jgi:hypothetical protein
VVVNSKCVLILLGVRTKTSIYVMAANYPAKGC